MFWIELIIVLAIIFIGVRVGGTFLAMAGGIGMFKRIYGDRGRHKKRIVRKNQ